jgi:hypothetical protein
LHDQALKRLRGGKTVMKGFVLGEKRRELMILLGFFIFGLLLFIASLFQPDFGRSHQSPGLFPAFIGMVMICITISQFIKLGIELKKNQKIGKITKGVFEKAEKGAIKQLLPPAMIVGYVLLLGHVNFLIVSFGFLFIIMFLLEAGSFKKIFLLSLISVLVLQLLFGIIFKIILP